MRDTIRAIGAIGAIGAIVDAGMIVVGLILAFLIVWQMVFTGEIVVVAWLVDHIVSNS